MKTDAGKFGAQPDAGWHGVQWFAMVTLGLLTACADDDADDVSDGPDSGADVQTPDAQGDGSSPDGGEPDGGSPDGGALEVVDIPEGCNPLAFEHDCFFPWPSDYFLQEDDSTPSGRAVVISGAAQVINEDGLVSDFNELHQADGFSHHPIIAMWFPEGVDTSSLPTWLDDPSPTTAPDSPTLLLNAETGEAIPHFAELDARPSASQVAALYVRPLVRLDNETRYVVALQGLTQPDGSPIEAPAGFRFVRDGVATTSTVLDELGARYETDVFPVLESFGVERSELILAWDFTTQSLESVTSDMLEVRRLAMESFEVSPPAVTIESVQEGSGEGGVGDSLAPYVGRRITGTITVPLYVESAETGALLARDEAGNIVQNGTAEARFVMLIPRSITEAEVPAPERVVQFGHGFFGGLDEMDSATQASIANEGGWTIAGVEWWGMSAPDLGPVAGAIADNASRTFDFTDRLHQGMVNYMAFAHALATTFQEVEAVQQEGVSLIDPEQVYFYGISQGHILGGTYFALSPQIERGMFSVGGASFTLMMSRASPFGQFLQFIGFKHDQLQVQKFIAMASTAMDRIDPITYAPFIFDQPLEGAPAERRMLIQLGLGDSSVPNMGGYLHARTLGIPVLEPTPEVPPLLSTVDVGTEGQDISGMLLVDFGINPRPDLEARLAAPANCVHGAVRELDFGIAQISAFLRPDGRVVFPCEGVCTSSCNP